LNRGNEPMALMMARNRTDARLPSEELKSAFDSAMAFPVDAANQLRLAPNVLVENVNQEAAFGRIIIDEQGFTMGMRLHLLEPARALISEWKQTRRRFDVAIEPKMRSIKALQESEGEIENARRRAERDEGDAEAKLESDQYYIRVKNEFHVAETRYQGLKSEHGNRNAKMAAHYPFYWLGLLGIGVAEWLINYDVFLLFSGVVAIAAGATLIMGVLLAFAAHGHGLLLKQWSYRFGEHRESIDRFGDWRLLALSTFSLLVVLGAATGSRYAAVMHQISGQPAINLLPDAQIAVSPMRDVMLSLLWNIMAWAVGVFIAYMAHDKDPDFMDATRQYNQAHRRYNRYRRPMVDKLQQLQAKLVKDIERLETTARTKMADVAVERDLLAQVDTHENALVNAIMAAVRGNAQTYRANLAQLASSQRGSVTIERTGPNAGQISPADFRNEQAAVTPDTIRGLV
jgi:hypothetical protein